MLKPDVTGVDLVHHAASLIDDFHGGVRPAPLFLPQGASQGDRTFPRGLRIGKIPADLVARQGGTFADMKVITGH
jgi:hypothetical protein